MLKSELDPILKIRGYKPGYGISGIKVAMEALGRAGGPVRPPGTQVGCGRPGRHCRDPSKAFRDPWPGG